MTNVSWVTGKMYPFTKENVDLSPEGKGVYALVRESDRAIVYIGSGDIRDRLQSHLGGDDDCIILEDPTHYVREETANHKQREKELIRAYPTLCNQKVG